MTTINFTAEKKTYIVPGSFNELTRHQLIKLAGIVNVNIEAGKKKLHVLMALLNVGRNPFTTFLFRFRIKAPHVVDMFPAAEWALKDPDLTKQLIPSIRIPYSFKKLYGPADHMKNLVFIEFIKAENNYNKFRKTGKIENLDNLVAILYRPKKENYEPTSPNHDGDIRERYNDYTFELRAKQIRRLDIRIKLAIMMHFYGSRQFIIGRKQFSHVFTSETKGKVEKSEGKYTWENVLTDLAEHVQYIDDVAYTHLYTVLILINDKIHKNKEQMKAIKKSNPRR
jgi:hypothetical protein